MECVNFQMRDFREKSRHIWNTWLNPGRGVLNLSVEDSFNVIEKELIRCLVLSHQPSAADQYRERPLGCLKVGLAEDAASAEIRVAKRDANNNILWDEAISTGADGFPDLRFFDFFDWDHYGSIDYLYVRAVEVGTNRLMLIPQRCCSFWLMGRSNDEG